MQIKLKSDNFPVSVSRCKILICRLKAQFCFISVNMAIHSIDKPISLGAEKRGAIPLRPVEEQFRIHRERLFVAEERPTTTVLVGGLSPTHDYLVEATLQNLGVKAQKLTPTALEDFHSGREYGNNGLCNPSYFMVGRLINYLRELENSGMSKADIIEKYVFFVAGCNAPCRFGMVETEYRTALKDCGFDGFRILVFQNEGGLNQPSQSNGLEVTPEFFLAVVNALNLADVINELAYATRPYEVLKGQTDAVRQKALDYLYDKLKNKKKIRLGDRWSTFFRALRFEHPAVFIYRFLDQLYSSYYTHALREVGKMFGEIEVDRFRSKAVVKITGEFWAMTTVRRAISICSAIWKARAP